MNWDKAIATVKPHVVKIATPAGYGTGFLALSNHDHTWCGIATAAHVVKHADDWQEPIRIQNSMSFRFLKFEERVIFPITQPDSAVVLFLKGDLQLPETPIALMPADQPCAIGNRPWVARVSRHRTRHSLLFCGSRERQSGSHQSLSCGRRFYSRNQRRPCFSLSISRFRRSPGHRLRFSLPR